MVQLNGKKQEILLSKGQMLKSADRKIAIMEKEAKAGFEHINKLTWQNAQLRMAVTALCMKFNVSTEKCKEIYNAYCEEEDKRLIAEQQKTLDEAKEKMKADIAAGKKVDFTAMNRDEEPKGE